jgi:hypothetical protein
VNDAHLHAAWLGARWPHLFSDVPAHEQPSGRLVRTDADRRDALRTRGALLAELGITSYTEPDRAGRGRGRDGMLRHRDDGLLSRSPSRGAQTARVTLLRLFGELDGTADLAAFEHGIRAPKPDTDPRWLAVTGVKIFADGIPDEHRLGQRASPRRHVGRAAAPGRRGALHAYRRMITLAIERGEQVAVHATGDRSIESSCGCSRHTLRPHRAALRRARRPRDARADRAHARRRRRVRRAAADRRAHPRVGGMQWDRSAPPPPGRCTR